MNLLFRFFELAAVMLATVVLFAVGAFLPEGCEAKPLRRRLPFVRILLGVAAVAGLVALTACGGGDPEDETAAPQQTTQPTPCADRPELCK